jgi:hypothetical protein
MISSPFSRFFILPGQATHHVLFEQGRKFYNFFESLAERKKEGDMKIRIKKWIVNRSPLAGVVLSVILSLSWGLVITFLWGQ